MEELIITCDSVKECCVVGVNISDTVVKTVAFIVLNDTYKKYEVKSEIRNKIEASDLPDYYFPNHYRYLNKLPINSAGKVDYRKLEQDFLDNNLKED